jgi:hypothetical protein
MIAALARWLSGDIQRLARRHLGAPVIRVETMSSYSCRNAYGRPGRRLSEHGRANALDIRAFVTARGQSALVVADWGPTAREVEAAIARAQALEATTAAAAAPTRPQESTGAGQAALAPVPAGPSGIDSRATFAIPGLSLTIPGVPSGPSELGLTQPNRLGGPKPATGPGVAPSAPAVQPRVKTQFLRAAHRSACQTFGTVLGPEANKAHKNHFHVDMAERKAVPVICE